MLNEKQKNRKIAIRKMALFNKLVENSIIKLNHSKLMNSIEL